MSFTTLRYPGMLAVDKDRARKTVYNTKVALVAGTGRTPKYKQNRKYAVRIEEYVDLVLAE